MKYRFISEYASYIKKRFQAADMPKTVKQQYIAQVETIVKRVHTGFITVSDCMKSLNNLETWLNNYNAIDITETHFI